MTKSKKNWISFVTVGTCLGVVVYFSWSYFQTPGLPENIISGNGRIEAVEIGIATKTDGRIKEFFANEGDFVVAGQVLARMDDAGRIVGGPVVAVAIALRSGNTAREYAGICSGYHTDCTDDTLCIRS